MPQAATPNMGLVRPTENGDVGVWASLLDAMFAQIDQHDHSAGKGVKVPLASGATVTADIPWNSGGSFFAITGLKAIDFQPQTAASMSAYQGALFCNSADNELYWRTTAGTVVKLTSGTALNIPGVGGFGGDYATAGALADFTDSTDTYAFRQQIGAAVRQFARVQSADLDLFEYKAQPAAGVPTTRVRLKSPAALAASYDLTFPAALPAVRAITRVDTAGNLTFQTSQTIKIPLVVPFLSAAGVAQPLQTSAANGRQIQLVGLPIGCRITSVKARIRDSAVGPTTLGLSFFSSTDNVPSATIATSSLSAGTGAFQTLTTAASTTTVASGTEYWAIVFVQTGTATCDIYSLEVTYDTL